MSCWVLCWHAARCSHCALLVCCALLVRCLCTACTVFKEAVLLSVSGLVPLLTQSPWRLGAHPAVLLPWVLPWQQHQPLTARACQPTVPAGLYSNSFLGYDKNIYGSSRDLDKLMVAAAWLGRATGEACCMRARV